MKIAYKIARKNNRGYRIPDNELLCIADESLIEAVDIYLDKYRHMNERFLYGIFRTVYKRNLVDYKHEQRLIRVSRTTAKRLNYNVPETTEPGFLDSMFNASSDGNSDYMETLPDEENHLDEHIDLLEVLNKFPPETKLIAHYLMQGYSQTDVARLLNWNTNLFLIRKYLKPLKRFLINYYNIKVPENTKNTKMASI